MEIWILLILLTIGTTATVLITLDRMQILNNYEAHRAKWMPEMCVFCLGFWLSIPVEIIFANVLHFEWHQLLIAVPFAAAAFINKLVVR
jgi:hypothetical protein